LITACCYVLLTTSAPVLQPTPVSQLLLSEPNKLSATPIPSGDMERAVSHCDLVCINAKGVGQIKGGAMNLKGGGSMHWKLG